MLFSSTIFIFFFLPTVLGIYYLVLRKHRTLQNVFLCIASLFFYAWGEPKFVLVMMLSIIMNYFLGLLTSSAKQKSLSLAKAFVAVDVLFNVTIIGIFKYLMFAVSNINDLFNSAICIPDIALPIGISFFTFQAISYVVDIYRGNGEAQRNILNVGLYISFFPQLIAGPIVRYETIADQINNRKETFDDFSQGVVRFIIGLGKKILIANQLAVVADYSFNMEGGPSSLALAWFGAIAYTLQIFFDFSGYSDMAIGLGKMFGFHFLENFNYPYISKSATEFWRRWHISLGTWFRDYVYIPLGGSRVKSTSRHILNLFVVWLCTGLWHGANWTFICWGLMYFVLLVFEKYSSINFDKSSCSTNWIKHIYALFFIIIGWVLFRADSVSDAIQYFQIMFGANQPLISSDFILYFRQYIPFLCAGIIFSTPIAKILGQRIKWNTAISILYAVIVFIILIISVSFIVKGSYNPFIYFNF